MSLFRFRRLSGDGRRAGRDHRLYLPRFRVPYAAASITTLPAALAYAPVGLAADYVYIPFGGNGGPKARPYAVRASAYGHFLYYRF
jgi:hypothetical protein